MSITDGLNFKWMGPSKGRFASKAVKHEADFTAEPWHISSTAC
jgi:hypothetical protein